MSAQVETMPRKPASFRIDERVLEVIATLATRSGMEPQRFLEAYFFARGKEMGLIPPDAQLLGETRGGKRAGAGKSKKSPDSTQSDDGNPGDGDRA